MSPTGICKCGKLSYFSTYFERAKLQAKLTPRYAEVRSTQLSRGGGISSWTPLGLHPLTP